MNYYIPSKIEAISNIKIYKLPYAGVRNAKRVVCYNRLLVILGESGNIYLNDVGAIKQLNRYAHKRCFTARHDVLQRHIVEAFVNFGLISEDDFKNHCLATNKVLEFGDRMANIRSIKYSANYLGIKLTKYQEAKLDKLAKEQSE